MEKYCPSCNSVFEDSNYKFCPYCNIELSEREGRQPIPRQLRHYVLERDNYTCRECGAHKDDDGVSLEIDHILPVAKGGTNDPDNLQTLCKECNRAKYTDEWIGGQTSLENLENYYYSLLEEKQDYEQKLQSTNNEEDTIEFKYQILKLDERLVELENKLQELRAERAIFEKQQEEKEKTDKVYKRLYVTITDSQLNLLCNHFINVEPSRKGIIDYLVNNYSMHEITQLLTQLEEKNNFSKKLYAELSDDQFELLYDYFTTERSKEKVVIYLANHYSKNEIFQLLDDLQKQKEIKDKISPRQFELLYTKFPHVTHSKEHMVRFLYSNFSEAGVNQLLDELQNEIIKLDKEERVKNNLSNMITDAQFKLFCYKFPQMNNSKRNVVDYLSENYSGDEIDEMLLLLENELPNKNKQQISESNYEINENEVEQRLTSEHLKLLSLLDTSFIDKSYMIPWFRLGFSENQIHEILNELDNIILQLNELDNQKNNTDFCILGYNNIWYYYYLSSNGDYERFYACSKIELEQMAFFKRLPWYKRFIFTISSQDTRVREFIGKLCSEISIERVGIPHGVYPITKLSNMLYQDLTSQLCSFNEEYNSSKELFKPVITSDSLPEFISCPNCGENIQRKAIRCKYCKTMMNDLLIKAGGELELFGLNPEEIIIVENKNE